MVQFHFVNTNQKTNYPSDLGIISMNDHFTTLWCYPALTGPVSSLSDLIQLAVDLKCKLGSRLVARQMIAGKKNPGLAHVFYLIYRVCTLFSIYQLPSKQAKQVRLQEMNSISRYYFFLIEAGVKYARLDSAGQPPPCYYWLFISPCLSLMYVGKGISNAYVTYIYSFLNIHWPRSKKLPQWFFHSPYLHLQVAQIHQCLWSRGQCNSSTFIQLEHTRV